MKGRYVLLAQDNFAYTFLFKDIIPTVDDFKEFLSTYTNVSSVDTFNEYCFKYLYNMYCNSNVKYDTEDAFCRHFGLTYENMFDQFKKRQAIVKKEYNLTDDELAMSRFAIVNNALDDNVHHGDDVDLLDKPLDYISAQNSSKERINLLQAYDEALYKITDNLLDEFIDEFRKHFICLFSCSISMFD